MSPCALCGDGFTPFLAPNSTQTLELTNILRSNAEPPDVGWLRGTVLEAPTELARYDAEIERIQNVLADLVSKRNALATYAEGCRSALPPIRRVPTELWVRIFELCSPRSLAFEEGYNPSFNTTPAEEVDRVSNWHLLQLSQVSSLWHRIAMDTPKLWSTIALDTSLWDDAAISHADLLSLLDLSLKRGGNHPLIMDVSVLEDDPQPHAVMILVSQHAARWKDVYFFSDLGSAQLLNRAKGNLGQLERLDVNADWTGVDVFQVAPRLTSVTYRGRVDNVPDMPWGQLRSFTYLSDSDEDATYFLSLLSRCPNVVTFLSRVALSQLPDDTPLTSHVEFLTLAIDLANIPDDASHIGRIFETLTLPSLKSLVVRPRKLDNSSPPVWDPEQFLGLADRSSFRSHLTRLEIDAIITDEGLLGCLAVLPHLGELILSDCTFNEEHVVINDTLLRGLVHKADATTLVPNLDFLSLTSRLRFTDSAYYDLLVSRLPQDGDDSFETHLWLLPNHQSEFSPDLLLAEIDNSDHKGTFSYTCGPSG
ncbi:hypothetical protein C8R47DRAFT_1231414 [Mycena vitilis]|nr:hypothetical protein C8R47DRAFT_1231414 [Mycena vitilis]